MKRPLGFDVDDAGRVVRVLRRPRPPRVELGQAVAPAGRPGAIPDRETRERLAKELERWARRFADVVISPIDLVRDVVGKLGGLPAALIVAGTLYHLTATEQRERAERKRRSR